MKKFLKYFLIFLFSISFFSYADSPENIRRHEARLQNHKNLSSADLQKIVKVLREYYIREKKDNELEKMNSLLLRVFSRTERQQELLKLLLELENISCKTAGNIPTAEERSRLNSLIMHLKEFRWYERNIARSLSYLGIARCYFLLRDYRMVIHSVNQDIELQKELDAKAAREGRKENSPLPALLFLSGCSFQYLAEAEQDRNEKIMLAAQAMDAYYLLVTEYSGSDMAQDALSRYENCRLALEQLTKKSFRSLAGFQFKNAEGSSRIPSNVLLMIKSGNYRQAMEVLERELKTSSGNAAPSVYLKALAEVSARQNNTEKCRFYLDELKKYSGSLFKESILLCANIFHDSLPENTVRLYEQYLLLFPKQSNVPQVKWNLAEVKFDLLNQRLAAGQAAPVVVSEATAEILKLCEEALDGTDQKEKRAYLCSRIGDLHFLRKDFLKAVEFYRQVPEKTIPENRLRLAKALYYSAISRTPPDQEILAEATGLLRGRTTAANEIRLCVKIEEALNHKKKAAELLLELAGRKNNRSSLADLAKAAALFLEAGENKNAAALLSEFRNYDSRDIVKMQFRLGVDLMKRRQYREASLFLRTALKHHAHFTDKELMFLIENLYDAKGPGAQDAWHIAFNAGRLFETVRTTAANRKLLANMRLKTAVAAMKLKNYPTALSLCDTALEENSSILYLPAKQTKAQVYMNMKEYALARYELTDIALFAARGNLTGIFLKTKQEIAKTYEFEKNMKQALTVLDGLLIPLKRDLENQPVKLPGIYAAILNQAKGYAEQMKDDALLADYNRIARYIQNKN